MADNVVPDTNDFTVAALAVAWEIVRLSYNIPNMMTGSPEKVKEATNAVIKAYTAIIKSTPIDK